MELTFDEALQKAADAHKDGQVQEAGRRYKDILKAQPKHPDANHNMGTLAIGVDKAQESLPFFKTALEANPSIGQYWLSYIDALIKLDRIADAKDVFDQAKDKGAKGEAFDHLEKRLAESTVNSWHPSSGQLQVIINLFNQGLMQSVLSESTQMLKLYPQSFVLYNLLGAANASLMHYDEAINSYQQALKVKPDYADAYNNMGIALHDKGNLEAAIDSYKQAVKIKSDYADAFYNMGNALKDKGDLNSAIDSYQKALNFNPDYAEAYDNMGNALKDKGDIEAAIDSYKKALKIKPVCAEAYCKIGVLQKNQGDLNAAKDSFKKALKINPDYAEAYYNMGNALNDKGDLDAALGSYQKALKFKPDYAEAYYNMGNTLKDKGNLEAAIDSYQQALKIKPNNAGAYNNMGIALQNKGDLDATIDCYKEALKIKPDYADAYNNMGNALKDKGDLKAAVVSYQKALKIKPDFAEAYYNIGNALQEKCELDAALYSYKKALKIKPDYAEAISQAQHVAALMVDWDYVASIKNDLLVTELKGNVTVYGLLAVVDEPTLHLEKTTALVTEKFNYTPQYSHSVLQKYKRIKIGYFSSYFRQHPVSVLSAQILEMHDREQFETYAFHYGRDNSDDYNLRMRETFDHFINVSKMSDKDIAELAFEKGIDIAIEFNGFMSDGRIGILAHRPAPIQINYLAYPGTMGAAFYDYIVADETIIPETQKCNYSENIIYLPNCYMPQDNTRQISQKKISRIDYNLPEIGFVFCCFNNSFKISPREFDIWMRLLSQIDGSVLWLLKTNKWAKTNLRNEALKRGINPDRLVFANNLELDEHLSRLRLADLFLDTFNFNAHTTASDALWAGLPVVTKMGNGFAARVAGSLLTSIEIPELITISDEDYEALALSLAIDPQKLTMIKNKLSVKRKSATLFDTETYTKNLEKAYIKAHKLFVDGLPPSEFKV
tara:strand:- start:9191 stop:12037 length:2847 start_codon:yes stop_codon:yes gene_type:complete